MRLSLLIVLAVGLGLVLFVWAVVSALPVVNRVATGAFWCPFRKRNVSAQSQEDPWRGRPVDITHCTAFEPTSAITGLVTGTVPSAVAICLMRKFATSADQQSKSIAGNAAMPTFAVEWPPSRRRTR